MKSGFRQYCFAGVFVSLLSAPALAQADSPSGDKDARVLVAEDESIYVVQERAYSKSGKFEVTPFVFTALNPKFVGYAGLGLSAAYHWRENFAIEITSSVPGLMQPFYSALVYEVYEYESLTPESVDLKQMTYFGAVSVQFSALYGKMELYGALLDYDFYVTGGVGLATTRQTCVPLQDNCGERIEGLGVGLKSPDDAGDGLKFAANLGGGARFFFSDFLGLRFEVRDVAYADRDVQPGTVTTDIRNTIMFMLGVSVLL